MFHYEYTMGGVRPAFRTKFTDEDTLDLVNFEVNIKEQLVAGVNGIILGGTLDEASTLTADEKRILIKNDKNCKWQKYWQLLKKL